MIFYQSIAKAVGYFRSDRPFIKRSSVSEVLVYDPISVPLALLFARVNFITPNIITCVSFLISIVACYFFFIGGAGLFYGAVIFYIANVLDTVDGKLARMKSLQSDFGAMLDRRSDQIRKALAMVALLYSSDWPAWWVFLIFVIIHYGFNYLPCPKVDALDEITLKNGLRSLHEPWDAMFILVVVGPLYNVVFESIIFVIVLRVAKVAYHFYRTPRSPLA